MPTPYLVVGDPRDSASSAPIVVRPGDSVTVARVDGKPLATQVSHDTAAREHLRFVPIGEHQHQRRLLPYVSRHAQGRTAHLLSHIPRVSVQPVQRGRQSRRIGGANQHGCATAGWVFPCTPHVTICYGLGGASNGLPGTAAAVNSRCSFRGQGHAHRSGSWNSLGHGDRVVVATSVQLVDAAVAQVCVADPSWLCGCGLPSPSCERTVWSVSSCSLAWSCCEPCRARARVSGGGWATPRRLQANAANSTCAASRGMQPA